ncbi:MAG: hypothetical protein ACOYJF_07475 [Prevotella sp.]|jgi:hypothetical protein
MKTRKKHILIVVLAVIVLAIVAFALSLAGAFDNYGSKQKTVLLQQSGLKVTARIDGRYISRQEMDKWMINRLRIAEKKLDLTPIPDGKPDSMLARLTEEKLRFSHQEIMDKLGSELSMSDKATSLMNTLSSGRTKYCITVMDVEGLDLNTFQREFDRLQNENSPENLKANIGVSPDHYYLGVNDKGALEVIENCGNNMMVSRFFITYGNEQGLNSPREAQRYERQSTGHAQLENGNTAGGVRHQFHRTKDGFEAKLLVEFPALTPSTIIKNHQVHLALEFSNWVKYVKEHCNNSNEVNLKQ